ncbi:unnamed protein product [Closterium sp. NIES-65]|nr:unnamed protein product [Closterium sp. NIES-65]
MAEQKLCGGAPARAPCCRRRPRRRCLPSAAPAAAHLPLLLALLLPSVLLPPNQLQRATAQFPGFGDPLLLSCNAAGMMCATSGYKCYSYNSSSVHNCSCDSTPPACTKWNAPVPRSCTDPTTIPCVPGVCLVTGVSFQGCSCPKGFFQTATPAGSPYCAPVASGTQRVGFSVLAPALGCSHSACAPVLPVEAAKADMQSR